MFGNTRENATDKGVLHFISLNKMGFTGGDVISSQKNVEKERLSFNFFFVFLEKTLQRANAKKLSFYAQIE